MNTIYCSYHRYIMSSNNKNKMTNILEFESVSIFHKDSGCARSKTQDPRALRTVTKRCHVPWRVGNSFLPTNKTVRHCVCLYDFSKIPVKYADVDWLSWKYLLVKIPKYVRERIFKINFSKRLLFQLYRLQGNANEDRAWHCLNFVPRSTVRQETGG